MAMKMLKRATLGMAIWLSLPLVGMAAVVMRGDVNADGRLAVADVVHQLSLLQ